MFKSYMDSVKADDPQQKLRYKNVKQYQELIEVKNQFEQNRLSASKKLADFDIRQGVQTDLNIVDHEELSSEQHIKQPRYQSSLGYFGKQLNKKSSQKKLHMNINKSFQDSRSFNDHDPQNPSLQNLRHTSKNILNLPNPSHSIHAIKQKGVGESFSIQIPSTKNASGSFQKSKQLRYSSVDHQSINMPAATGGNSYNLSPFGNNSSQMNSSLQQTVRNLYDPGPHSNYKSMEGNRVNNITYKSNYRSTQNKMHLNIQKSLMNAEKYQLKLQSKLNDSFKYNTLQNNKNTKRQVGKLKGFAENVQHGKSSLPSIKSNFDVDSQNSKSYMNIKEQLTTLTPSLRNISNNIAMAQRSKRKLKKVQEHFLDIDHVYNDLHQSQKKPLPLKADGDMLRETFGNHLSSLDVHSRVENSSLILTADNRVNNRLSLVDLNQPNQNTINYQSDRDLLVKTKAETHHDVSDNQSLFSSTVANPREDYDDAAHSASNALTLKGILEKQKQDQITFAKIKLQVKQKELAKQALTKATSSNTHSKSTFETRKQYERSRDIRAYKEQEQKDKMSRDAMNEISDSQQERLLNNIGSRLILTSEQEIDSNFIQQEFAEIQSSEPPFDSESPQYPLNRNSQSNTARNLLPNNSDLKLQTHNLGQHQPAESTNYLNTVDEETFMMTKTNELKEKRSIRIPASITISQTETPSSAVKQQLIKKSSSIADIYQDGQLQLKLIHDKKFRERNKSNSVVPTQQVHVNSTTNVSKIQAPKKSIHNHTNIDSRSKSSGSERDLVQEEYDRVFDLNNLAEVAQMDKEMLMISFQKNKRAKDANKDFDEIMRIPGIDRGADPNSPSKTSTPKFSNSVSPTTNLERQITVTDQIIKKKLEKAKKFESERKTIGMRRNMTKEKLKEIRIKQVQEMMKIKKKFVEEFQLDKKIQREQLESPKKSIQNVNEQILQNRKNVEKQYTIMMDEFILKKKEMDSMMADATSISQWPQDTLAPNSPLKQKSTFNRNSTIGKNKSIEQTAGATRGSQEFLKMTGMSRAQIEEAKLIRYVKMQQRRLEIQRDHQYKDMLFTYSKVLPRKDDKMDLTQLYGNVDISADKKGDEIYSKSQSKFLVEKFTGLDKLMAGDLGYLGKNVGNGNREGLVLNHKEIDDFFLTQSRSNSELDNNSQAKDTFYQGAADLNIARPALFDQQYDNLEALEYNGEDIPQEYLIAKLSFTRDQADNYRDYKIGHRPKEDDQRNTGYHFAKADVFNTTHGSFNMNLKSDMPDEEIDGGMDYILKEFQKKNQFLQVLKKNNKNQGREVPEQKRVHSSFVKSAEEYGNLPLPILLKIKKSIFYVPSLYVITEGMACAIRDSLPQLESLDNTQLTKAILQKNKMSDKILSHIILGLRTRPEFYSFSSTLNEIGESSAKQICNLLRRTNEDPVKDCIVSMPTLRELKLINNKSDPKALNLIIDAVKDSTTIKKLSLQKMDLSERHIRTLFDFLKTSNIAEFDISWNKIPSAMLAYLFQSLETNMSIQNLNLGWIQMGAQMSGDELLKDNFPKFCSFLKENKKLIHLNLTSICLPNDYMIELISNIKRSQSLHCVHLCGNRLNEECVEHMHKKLKPTFINNMEINKEKAAAKERLLLKLESTIRKNYQKKYEKLYDAVLNKEYMMEWMSVQEQYQNLTEDSDYFVPLILNKQLGHPEIINSKHWKISNECYQCDKWKYTMIFWDLKGSGKKFQIQDPMLEEMLDDLVQNSSTRLQEQKNEKLGDQNNSRAYISGTFTNWEPRRMMQIDQLCACIEGKPDVLQDQDRRMFYSDMVKSTWRRVLAENVPYSDEDTQYIEFPSDDMYTAYKPPEINYDQLFVYVDFIKPGKHQYLVTYKNTLVEPEPPKPKSPTHDKDGFPIIKLTKQVKKKKNEPVFVPKVSKVKLVSYHQFLGRAHTSDYNVNIKVNDVNAIQREFDKDKSVFKDWKLDNKKNIQKGMLDELSYWKVPNFVKDEEECEKIVQFMLENAEFLKTLFIIKTSYSQFPSIRFLSWNAMITGECNIVDENFDSATVDRTYIAVTANMNAALKGILPEQFMSRYQFYEGIVRIANFKYKLNGLTENTYEGLKILVNDVFKKTYDNHVWMGWRVQKLWKLEIDDLYKSNLKPMKKLYEYYFKVKKTKIMYLDDAIDQFTKEVQLDLLPEQVMQCWGLAKMTCNNDVKVRKQYFEAQFVEYLEFFARMADVKYKDHRGLQLQDKIELLMDVLFPIVNAKRKEVVIEMEYVSVSEEELVEDKYYNIC